MIESLQNDKVKFLQKIITDNRFRRKSGVFCVEGRQENERAIKFGFQPKEFFICEEFFQGGNLPEKTTSVSARVYEKLAYRGSSEGILGIFESAEKILDEYTPPKDATIMVVEGAEKPGNLGAILRSCEAFGVDAVIVTGEKTDFFNPNVIRSSVGCLFGMNIFSADNPHALKFLQKNGISIYSTFMDDDAVDISEVDLRKNSAVLFGTEHSGLTDFWRENSQNIRIPMAGTIDSLNLSNAVAIFCYEALRQKKSRRSGI